MTTQPKEVGAISASDVVKASLAIKSRAFVCLKCGVDHNCLLGQSSGKSAQSRWMSLDDVKAKNEREISKRKKPRRKSVKRSSISKHLSSHGRTLALISLLFAILAITFK